MGFFKDLREDISQAVNELLPDDSFWGLEEENAEKMQAENEISELKKLEEVEKEQELDEANKSQTDEQDILTELQKLVSEEEQKESTLKDMDSGLESIGLEDIAEQFTSVALEGTSDISRKDIIQKDELDEKSIEDSKLEETEEDYAEAFKDAKNLLDWLSEDTSKETDDIQFEEEKKLENEKNGLTMEAMEETESLKDNIVKSEDATEDDIGTDSDELKKQLSEQEDDELNNMLHEDLEKVSEEVAIEHENMEQDTGAFESSEEETQNDTTVLKETEKRSVEIISEETDQVVDELEMDVENSDNILENSEAEEMQAEDRVFLETDLKDEIGNNGNTNIDENKDIQEVKDMEDLNLTEDLVEDTIDAQEEPTIDEKNIEKEVDTMENNLVNAEAKDEVTVITKGTVINGSISSDGSLEVNGTITGDVECLGKLSINGNVSGHLKAAEVIVSTPRLDGGIESRGDVKVGVGTIVLGDVSAKSATISGAVKGEIDVNGPVVVDSTAIVKGNITAKSVQINNGAVVDGYCKLSYAEVDIDNFFDENE